MNELVLDISLLMEAFKCGLVNEVISADKLLLRATEIAEKMCNTDYDMMVTLKKLIEVKNEKTLYEAMTIEQNGFKHFLEGFGK